MVNLHMGSMPDYYPSRETQVEAWIKDRRDQYTEHENGFVVKEWKAIDTLLDEYREAADTGRSLFETVNGPDADLTATTRGKKP